MNVVPSSHVEHSIQVNWKWHYRSTLLLWHLAWYAPCTEKLWPTLITILNNSKIIAESSHQRSLDKTLSYTFRESAASNHRGIRGGTPAVKRFYCILGVETPDSLSWEPRWEEPCHPCTPNKSDYGAPYPVDGYIIDSKILAGSSHQRSLDKTLSSGTYGVEPQRFRKSAASNHKRIRGGTPAVKRFSCILGMETPDSLSWEPRWEEPCHPCTPNKSDYGAPYPVDGYIIA